MNETNQRTSPFDWNDDGHLLRVTIDGSAGFRFSVVCPNETTDLSGVEFGKLPACRRTYDEFGTARIDWAPAKECSVALYADNLAVDDLFDGIPQFDVVSPLRIEYRWDGPDADALYMRPVAAEASA